MPNKKQTQKNPLPMKMDLTIAFDVSTTKTGYAILLNGKPMLLANGKYSVGQIDMIIKEPSKKDPKVLTKKDKVFKNYGDKMLHGSRAAIDHIGGLVYACIKPINDIIGNILQQNKELQKKGHKGIDVPKVKTFNIVYEISEIPNYGKFAGGRQTITSVRKLALFVGAVQEMVGSTIYAGGFHFAHKAEQKLIKPTEWQERLFRKQGDRKKTKAMSIKLANIKLRKWGIQEINSNFDDMADAINIASVADLVRDNLFVSAINKNTSKNVSQMKQELAQAIEQTNNLILKAQTKKVNHIERIRESKNSKFNVKDENAKAITKFMDAEQLRSYNRNNEKRKILETKLKDIRERKVYGNNKN